MKDEKTRTYRYELTDRKSTVTEEKEMQVSAELIEKIDQALILLFDKEAEKGLALVNDCNAIEFLDPRAFKIWYLLSEQLRMYDVDKHQAMIRFIRRASSTKPGSEHVTLKRDDIPDMLHEEEI